jgi:multidrug resistance efflux pump
MSMEPPDDQATIRRLEEELREAKREAAVLRSRLDAAQGQVVAAAAVRRANCMRSGSRSILREESSSLKLS